MIYTGLVSVTFRKLQPDEVIELVKRAGLQGIEWGGDVHVPHGNIKRANEVLKMTLDAGLQVASYGSYYTVGKTNAVSFEKVLETAVKLHAPTVRVWAGNRASDGADAGWWHDVIDDTIKIAAQAAKAGVMIAFEYHEQTLTDTSESACRLMREINLPNVCSYWQPPMGMDFAMRLSGLQEIALWLNHLHVYNQFGTELEPLAGGVAEWLKYMEIVNSLPGDRFCMIEFVKDDLPGQFLEDAEALKKIVLNGSKG